MNTEHDTAGAPALPELSEERIDAIEQRVFAGIAADRTSPRRRTLNARGWLIGGAAAAAVIVVAAVAIPVVGSLTQQTASYESAPYPFEDGRAVDSTVPEPGVEGSDGGNAEPVGPEEALIDPATSQREMITTATVGLEVQNIPEAADAIAKDAAERGGYVMSMNVVGRERIQSGATVESELSYPWGTHITVRIPADQLADATSGLDAFGKVLTSRVEQQDVTAETVDLRARIESTQASVDRLIELMAQAGTISDLLEVESTLADRQAELESYQRQLESLEGQVAMATLTVELSGEAEVVTPDEGTFLDGLNAGLAVMATLANAAVVTIGFLLPWTIVGTVIGLLIWAVIAILQTVRRRSPGESGESN